MKQQGLDFGPPPRAPKKPRPQPPPRRRALSVDELTQRISGTLEGEFSDVWVEGEISNFKRAASGHLYFSLKDDKAQLKAVMWKTAAARLRFEPRDGTRVVARGGVRVYAPRGDYQLSAELLEPLGKGSLQQAFEDLKRKLEAEGLFAAERKRPLPLLPRRIGVVTSPSGSVIRDMLHVLRSRFANLEVLIYPARVQGTEATAEVVAGIQALNGIDDLDVLIVARGGGSIEDLWCFNEEAVARALAASRIPTISAVGHETDFTIADFVADLRAPTPSAAAERVVQAKEDLAARTRAFEDRLVAALNLRLARIRQRVDAATSHRVFEAERGRLRTAAQRVDELVGRAGVGLRRGSERAGERLRRSQLRLDAFRWDRQLSRRQEHVTHLVERLDAVTQRRIQTGRGALGQLAGKLESLSPVAVLGRGYSLVWDGERQRLLREPAQVEVGDALRIRLHGGELDAEVTGKTEKEVK